MTDITIRSIAGFCNEYTLWKMLLNICSEILISTDKVKMLTPDMIIIDGDNFRISDAEVHTLIPEFFPPEGMDQPTETGLVWVLGALVCYASSGHYVFGGRGGMYQRSNPNVELPTLKKEHSALSALVKSCLCFSPSQRINLEELKTAAQKGLESIKRMKRPKRMEKPILLDETNEYVDDVWPEKMV